MSAESDAERLLRQLAESMDVATSRIADLLDRRTRALVGVGAAVCGAAPATTFETLVAEARDVGVSDDEILGAVLAVAAVAGEPRMVAAAPRVARALGYDLDRAFEQE